MSNEPILASPWLASVLMSSSSITLKIFNPTLKTFSWLLIPLITLTLLHSAFGSYWPFSLTLLLEDWKHLSLAEFLNQGPRISLNNQDRWWQLYWMKNAHYWNKCSDWVYFLNLPKCKISVAKYKLRRESSSGLRRGPNLKWWRDLGHSCSAICHQMVAS